MVDGAPHASSQVAVSIIIPVYNCASSISSTITKISGIMEGLGRLFQTKGLFKERLAGIADAFLQAKVARPAWYELVVVNDGSRDGTKQAVEERLGLDGRIRLISYSKNMGKGYAIRQGVIHSRGKYLVFVDGDGNVGSDSLMSYLQRLDDVDIAVGSKYHPGSQVKVPLSRRILSKGFQALVHALFRLSVKDTQVGFKAGRGEALRRIFRHMVVRRYAFDVEMLAIGNVLGYRVVEMPVTMNLDRRFRLRDIAKMATDLLAITYRLRVTKQYQKKIAGGVAAQ